MFALTEAGFFSSKPILTRPIMWYKLLANAATFVRIWLAKLAGKRFGNLLMLT